MVCLPAAVVKVGGGASERGLEVLFFISFDILVIVGVNGETFLVLVVVLVMMLAMVYHPRWEFI